MTIRAAQLALLCWLLPCCCSAFKLSSRVSPPQLSSQVSEVNTALPTTLQKKASISVAGATALVAGTTVGAGILALPAKTIEAGFGPSAVALVVAWAYMAASALLIAEVNVNTLCALGRTSVSIKSMAGQTIGETGSQVASVAYAFIHYALLVAYMLEGGKLLGELVPPLASAVTGVPDASIFAAIGGGALLLGSTAQVDKANSALFVGVIGAFFAIVGVGASKISLSYLAHATPSAALPAVPVMVLSFTFHNVVPTIAYQLGCDIQKIRTAILAGSAIPLLMFLLWDAVVLGSVPLEVAQSALQAGSVFDPLEAVRAGGDSLGQTVRVFSLLAICTSFIGFCYGLVDFYADLLDLDNRLEAEARTAAASTSTAMATSSSPSQPSMLTSEPGDEEGDPYAEEEIERPLPWKEYARYNSPRYTYMQRSHNCMHSLYPLPRSYETIL